MSSWSLSGVRYIYVASLALIFLVTLVHYSYIRAPHAPSQQEITMAAEKRERKSKTGTLYKMFRPTMFHKKGSELYLHAAFWDERFNQSALRIFGIIHRSKFKKKLICRTLPRNNVSQEQTLHANLFLIDRKWPKNSPYLSVEFACNFPWNIEKTDIVSIYSKDKSLHFEFEVDKTADVSPRRELVVCVKPITGDFGAKRLVEWVETLRQTGVDRFIFYQTDVTGSARYVLDHYVQEGILTVISFPFLLAVMKAVEGKLEKSWHRSALHQQLYLVALNEFVVKYRKAYKYMMLIDLDEVIAPPVNQSILNIIHKAHQLHPEAGAFTFLTAWHFEDFGSKKGAEVSDSLYMQKYLKSTFPIGNQPKSVMVADQAINVNWHSVVAVRSTNIKNVPLPWKEYGYVHHYRGKCSNKFTKADCVKLLSAGTMMDTVLPQYREAIARRTKRVMDKLQLP